MKNKMVAFLELTRPTIWGAYLFPFVEGIAYGAPFYKNLDLLTIFFVVFSTITSLSLAFTVNYCYDTDVDTRHDGKRKDADPKKQPILAKKIGLDEAKNFSIILLLLSLTGFLVNKRFGWAVLMLSVCGILYSVPPFRFKARPFLDVILNAFVGGVLLLFAGASIQPIYFPWVVLIADFIIGACWFLPTVIADYSFDKRTGLKTTAVFLGRENVFKLFKLLYLLSVIAWLVIAFGNYDIILKISALTPLLLSSVSLLWRRVDLNQYCVWPSYLLVGILSIVAILRYFST